MSQVKVCANRKWFVLATEKAVLLLALVPSVARLAVELSVAVVWSSVTTAAAAVYYGLMYALWPLVVGIPPARRALPYLLLWPLAAGLAVVSVVVWAVRLSWRAVRLSWRAVRLSWRISLFVAVRCRPQYWADRREEAAFKAWTRLSRDMKEAVAEHLRLLRRKGQTVNGQTVRIVEQEKWARDGGTQKELLTICSCHPELESPAKELVKEIRKLTTGRIDIQGKPDTIETMHDLWRAAWRYREAERAAELAEARKEAYEKVSPAERFDKWRKIGMYGGAAAIVFGFLYAYPLQTLVLVGIAVVMAAVTLGAKAVAHLKKLSEPEAKVQPPTKESNHGDRVLRALSDRRQPVRGL